MRRSAKFFDVITIGSAVRDLIVISKKIRILPSKFFRSGYAECLELGAKNDIDDVHLSTGGGATNAAVTFAKLGFQTGIFSELGGDTLATEIREELKALDITDFTHLNPRKKTALSVVLSNAGSDRSILTFRGASAEITLGHFPLHSIGSRWFYITSLHGNLAGIEMVLDRADKINARVAWNPGSAELDYGFTRLRPLISRTHLFNLNLDEAKKLTGSSGDIDAQLKILRGRAEYTCITDGENGAWLATETHTWHVRSHHVKVLNTTGAGDAFGSGLVAGFLEYQNPEEALQLAMLNATSVIQHIGAKTGLLTRWPNAKELTSIRVGIWS